MLCLSVSLKEWKSSGRGGCWCLKGETGQAKKVNLCGALGVLWSFQRLKKVKCCYGNCLLSRRSYKNLRFRPIPSLTLYGLLQSPAGIPHIVPGPSLPTEECGVPTCKAEPEAARTLTTDFPHLPERLWNLPLVSSLGTKFHQSE